MREIDLVAKVTHAFLSYVKSTRTSGKTMLIYQGQNNVGVSAMWSIKNCIKKITH